MGIYLSKASNAAMSRCKSFKLVSAEMVAADQMCIRMRDENGKLWDLSITTFEDLECIYNEHITLQWTKERPGPTHAADEEPKP